MLRVKTQPAVNYSIRLLKRQESKKKLKTHGKRLDTSGEQQSFPRLLLDNQAPFNNQRCRPCWPMVFFLFPVFLPHTFHCVKFFFLGGGFWGVIRPTFSESEILSPLCILPPSPPPTPLSPVFSQLDWVQPLRLEARVYLELKRKLFRSCAPPGEGRLRFGRWGERERTEGRGFDFFCINSGLWGRVGSYGGAFCALGAFIVPTIDIILSPGKSY